METITVTPPAHLPEPVAQEWRRRYQAALAQARVNYPDNQPAQSAAALKGANTLLAVPAPNSAAEIDTLEEWQVLHRSTRDLQGQPHRVVVTSDGRKYAHPVLDAGEDAGEKGGGKKKK